MLGVAGLPSLVFSLVHLASSLGVILYSESKRMMDVSELFMFLARAQI